MKAQRSIGIRSLSAVGLAAVLATPALADVVTDWNTEVLNTIRATRTPPPPATRALAMTHVAMFDAMNGIARLYTPYAIDRPAPPGASPDAAAATAAYHVLVDLFPARKAELQAALSASLEQVPRGAARYKGEGWGRFVGQKIVALRAADGASDFVAYTPSGEVGDWRPTPPAFLPALLPQWAHVRPFAMSASDQFRAPAPPALASDEFAVAFAEVHDMGAKEGSLRTADQTQIAFFWEDGAGSVTPPGHWQMIAQDLAQQFGNDPLTNARLFALLSIVQADAAISSWDAKFHYDYCRPVTAIIEEAALDENESTQVDAAWSSLIPTPPFPSYTSGHSTFSRGSAQLLALFFGTDEIAFSGSSPDPQRWPLVLPGVVRSWDSLSQAAAEAGQSRIYGGIHWQFDNQAGQAAGSAIADWAFEHYLKPAPEKQGHGFVRRGALWGAR
jgi:PAP2 superfamily